VLWADLKQALGQSAREAKPEAGLEPTT
jgi:hypothetical protein